MRRWATANDGLYPGVMQPLIPSITWNQCIYYSIGADNQRYTGNRSVPFASIVARRFPAARGPFEAMSRSLLTGISSNSLAPVAFDTVVTISGFLSRALRFTRCPRQLTTVSSRRTSSSWMHAPLASLPGDATDALCRSSNEKTSSSSRNFVTAARQASSAGKPTDTSSPFNLRHLLMLTQLEQELLRWCTCAAPMQEKEIASCIPTVEGGGYPGPQRRQ